MSASLIGLTQRGRSGSYRILGKFHPSHKYVWYGEKADSTKRPVVLKIAYKESSDRQVNFLKNFRHVPTIRPITDIVSQVNGIEPSEMNVSPRFLVFERLNYDLVTAVRQNLFSRQDAKRAARVLLETLVPLHEVGVVLGDLKPDNILANKGSGNAPFTNFQVCDVDSASPVDVETNNGSHPLGAWKYMSPEVLISKPWALATDMWSFGATALYLLSGWHVFGPPGVDENQETFYLQVLQRQEAVFGPFLLDIAQSMPAHAANVLRDVANSVREQDRIGFWNTLSTKITEEDRAFFSSFMKGDPTERPSAKQLLQSPWFNTL